MSRASIRSSTQIWTNILNFGGFLPIPIRSIILHYSASPLIYPIYLKAALLPPFFLQFPLIYLIYYLLSNSQVSVPFQALCSDIPFYCISPLSVWTSFQEGPLQRGD